MFADQHCPPDTKCEKKVWTIHTFCEQIILDKMSWIWKGYNTHTKMKTKWYSEDSTGFSSIKIFTNTLQNNIYTTGKTIN